VRKYLIFPFEMSTGSLAFGEVDVLTYYDHDNASDHVLYAALRKRHGVTDDYPCQGPAGVIVDAHRGAGTLWFLATAKYLGLHTYREYLFGMHAVGRGYTSVLLLGTPSLVAKYRNEEMPVCVSMPQKRMDDFLSLSAYGVPGATYDECYAATISKINTLHSDH
jgi:hypothetical protein